MKKEKLMTSFFLANAADAAITWFALKNLDFQEANNFADHLMEGDNVERAIIFKFALMSLLISLYAISSDNESKFKYSTEKALQIGNFLVWLVVISNILQVSAEII